jgi:hypothetical protein
MAQPNSALSSPREAAPEPVPEDTTSWRDVVQLIRRAAQLAAERGVDSDLFMQAAWAACLDARPGLRAQLEDKELRKELRKLRKRGLVAAA